MARKIGGAWAGQQLDWAELMVKLGRQVPPQQRPLETWQLYVLRSDFYDLAAVAESRREPLDLRLPDVDGHPGEVATSVDIHWGVFEDVYSERCQGGLYCGPAQRAQALEIQAALESHDMVVVEVDRFHVYPGREALGLFNCLHYAVGKVLGAPRPVTDEAQRELILKTRSMPHPQHSQEWIGTIEPRLAPPPEAWREVPVRITSAYRGEPLELPAPSGRVALKRRAELAAALGGTGLAVPRPTYFTGRVDGFPDMKVHFTAGDQPEVVDAIQRQKADSVVVTVRPRLCYEPAALLGQPFHNHWFGKVELLGP